jgi:hypothetical protein
MNTGNKLSVAAMKSGMSENTARKYLEAGEVPSRLKKAHTWRTRPDPFEEVWPWVKDQLGEFPGLEAKTLFEVLQREYPGRFGDGQLRTLQRRVKQWRAIEGPGKEVYFPQKHRPGELGASDFTRMGSLGITIQKQPFDHLLYHFILTYSNWEDVSICFSESYESLSYGLQNALWRLGGTPQGHRTDRMSSAVNNLSQTEEFTKRYDGLMNHYGMRGQKIQGGKANENGDVEQSHHRFKKAVDQALMLRGSRDFENRDAYEQFLRQMLTCRNAGRQERLKEEEAVLHALPATRLEDAKRFCPTVGPSSTIRVQHNVYSVHSRLIGEKVVVRVHAEHLDVWYGQKRVESLPRLRGEEKHRIDYRHIIDWLVRKPGAFANYRYKSDLFPTSRFRIAYDLLKERHPSHADKEYLKILHLAAQEGERAVNTALGMLIDGNRDIARGDVEEVLKEIRDEKQVRDPKIVMVDLQQYDELAAVVGVAP